MAENFLIDEAKNLIEGVDKRTYDNDRDKLTTDENLVYALASSFIWTDTGTVKNTLMGITNFYDYIKRVGEAGYTIPDLSILGDFYDSDSSYRYSDIGDKPMKSLQNAHFGTDFGRAFYDLDDLLEIRTIRLPNALRVTSMFQACSNLKRVESVYFRDEKFEVYPDFESYYDFMAYSKLKAYWCVLANALFYNTSSLEHIGHIDLTNVYFTSLGLISSAHSTNLTTFPDSQITGRYWNQVITAPDGKKHYPNTELLSNSAYLFYGMTNITHFNDDPLTEHPWNFVRSFSIVHAVNLDYESLIKIINGVVYSEGTDPNDRVMTVCQTQRDKLTTADIAVLEGKGFTLATV